LSKSKRAELIGKLQDDGYTHVIWRGRAKPLTELAEGKNIKQMMESRPFPGSDNLMQFYRDNHPDYLEAAEHYASAQRIKAMSDAKMQDAQVMIEDAAEKLAQRAERKQVRAVNKQARRIGGNTMELKSKNSPTGKRTVSGPFSDDEQGGLRRLLSSSGDTYSSMLAGYAEIQKQGYRLTERMSTHNPGDANYWVELERQTNRILRNDPVAMAIFEGQTDDWIANELTKSKRGQAAIRDLSGYGSNLAEGIATRREQIEQMLPDPSVHRILAEREMSADELLGRLGGNPLMTELKGFGYEREMRGAARKATSKMMRALGTIPEDAAIRHPYYRRVWKREMQRQVDMFEGQNPNEMTQQQLEAMSRVSHDYALKAVRRDLYTIQRTNNIGNFLRYVMPFYAAWENTAMFWAKRVYENPTTLVHASMLWNAPDQAGIVVDKDNNVVKGDRFQSLSDMLSGSDGEKYMVLPVPGFTGSDVNGFGQMKISKAAVNVVLQGELPWTPSLGPLVTIGPSYIAKKFPELEKLANDNHSSLLYRWMVPFGQPTQEDSIGTSTINAVLPAAARRMLSSVMHDDAFMKTVNEVHRFHLTQWELDGRVGKAPTVDDTIRDTQSFMLLRAFANLTLPAAPSFIPNNQMYVDGWRRIQAAHRNEPNGYQMAREEFLDTYGAAYFRYTQSLTQSPTGMDPTQVAHDMYKQNENLVKDVARISPEMVGFVTNSNGKGDFSAAVYAWQMNNEMINGLDIRSQGDPDAVEKRNQIALGWLQYSRAMATINSMASDRGLDNYKKDPELLDLQRRMVANGEKMNPDWGDAHKNMMGGNYRKNVRAALTVVNDSDFMDRYGNTPQWTAVKQWSDLRTQVVSMLQQRSNDGGSKSITAKSNADIADAWASEMAYLSAQSPVFGDMYSRYLDSDQLEEVN
jgi:hypothetical protein